jgi:hypothetical protein
MNDASLNNNGFTYEFPKDRVIPYAFDKVRRAINLPLHYATTKYEWGFRCEDIGFYRTRYTFKAKGIASPQGVIEFYDSDNKTTFTIRCEFVSDDKLSFPHSFTPTRQDIDEVITITQAVLEEALQVALPELQPVKPDRRTAVQIIEKYYRRHARNKKLTFRQHLLDLGEESRESYIRKVKSTYDKQHGKNKKG